MKSILLIGLGQFGKQIAMKLSELNHDVMAIDRDEERVNEIAQYVSNAQIGDSTNREFLESLGINSFDVCIVAIGGDFAFVCHAVCRFRNRNQRSRGYSA